MDYHIIQYFRRCQYESPVERESTASATASPAGFLVANRNRSVFATGKLMKISNSGFNWRLILAPPEILDYVVVHELCHLTHMNHSKEFWGLVESVIPDYKNRRKWLKENGHTLRL